MTNQTEKSVRVFGDALVDVSRKTEYRAKKVVPAKVKTVDGLLLAGNLYIRSYAIALIDELNNGDENFIALTDVSDSRANNIPFTFLVNFPKIIYVAVTADSLRMDAFTPDKNHATFKRREVAVFVRLEDGTDLSGMIHVRESIKRAKDELNAKEGKFIMLTGVNRFNGSIDPDVYYINKEHVIYFAVKDDQTE